MILLSFRVVFGDIFLAKSLENTETVTGLSFQFSLKNMHMIRIVRKVIAILCILFHQKLLILPPDMICAQISGTRQECMPLGE